MFGLEKEQPKQVIVLLISDPMPALRPELPRSWGIIVRDMLWEMNASLSSVGYDEFDENIPQVGLDRVILNISGANLERASKIAYKLHSCAIPVALVIDPNGMDEELIGKIKELPGLEIMPQYEGGELWQNLQDFLGLSLSARRLAT